VLNPLFNGIVNLAPDCSLLREADESDAELARGESRGWMHGFPQAIEDTSHAAGFPTTLGGPLLKDAVATQDSVMTARMKAAACIVVCKTNMPEFGLGWHTFNEQTSALR
jgi:amidase